MIDLTQTEADILLAMEKRRLNDDHLRCPLPVECACNVTKVEA